MKRRTLVFMLILLASFGVATAFAADRAGKGPEAPAAFVVGATIDPCPTPFTYPEFRRVAKEAWSLKRWESRPVAGLIMRARHMEACAAGPGHTKAMHGLWRERKRLFASYREYREIAPYEYGGEFWAVPASIVACESGGDWSAYNPSGALGPYQLLGWGAPYPVATWEQKMAHHRIAASLWAGGAGASHWAQCL